jgi:5-methyltetrahydropteroyltriglutamate--homocysteine methyltransferase
VGSYPKIPDPPAPGRWRTSVEKLQLKNDNYALPETFKSPQFTKDIGLGVLDAHTHRAETPVEVVDGIRRTLKVIPLGQAFVAPDCGLKTCTIDETVAKLTSMMEGTRRMREELSP